MSHATTHNPQVSKHRNISHPQTQFETRWWENGIPNGGARPAVLRLGAGTSEAFFCGTADAKLEIWMAACQLGQVIWYSH